MENMIGITSDLKITINLHVHSRGSLYSQLDFITYHILINSNRLVT